ncbi:hypothetical protein ACIBF1_21880 [Spirillospora sp. NPDC050679]
MASAYWDPLPTVRDSAGTAAFNEGSGEPFTLPPPEAYLLGQWEKRDWRNVPGPFYGAETDTCWVGRVVAPAHILYNDGYGEEFVYRQPRTASQVEQVLLAAWNDPFCAYACDGDEHWDLPSVRDWWRERHRLREWIDRAIGKWLLSDRAEDREVVSGLHEYAAYLDGELSLHLCGYMFWLDRRRTPRPGELLPDL